MKRKFLAGIVMVICVAGGVGCEANKVVTVHGNGLFTTNAPKELGRALIMTHQRLANWIPGEGNGRSDPTFRQSVRTWSSGDTREDARAIVSRGFTEFNDAEGRPVRIETIGETGRVMVFVEYNVEGGPLAITNEIVGEMQKLGVDLKLRGTAGKPAG